MKKWLNLVAGAMLYGAIASAAPAADDPIAAARDLYAAAEYENALSLLNQLRLADHRPEEARTIEQYRAFCLLALGRPSDAEQAIAAVVIAEPSYQPSNGDVSPRVRTAFSDVRRRMLPAIIQEKYAAAKMAFDQKNFIAAATGFEQVLLVMADPDVSTAVNQPPLSDLRQLAKGFRELSAAAAVPPPPPPSAAASVAVAEPPLVPGPPRIYTADDPEVLPPGVIRQVLPPFPSNILVAGQGILEVLIDENGNVQVATMRVPVSPRYDYLALEAAKSWKFRPATVSGQPVKYKKLVQVSVKR